MRFQLGIPQPISYSTLYTIPSFPSQTRSEVVFCPRFLYEIGNETWALDRQDSSIVQVCNMKFEKSSRQN